MTRNIFLFLGTFILGALIALVARSAMFEPHADHASSTSSGGEYAAMVTNTLSPADKTSSDDSHSAHRSEVTAAAAGQPVNTVCAICGMEVDPSLPTVEYQGKTIGFGCRMCPPKFKADPDRWGPIYLRNEVAKK